MVQDIEIYRYFNYREYLVARFPAKGKGRGERKRLAEEIGCQPGFISLVFSGKSDFSPEHGMQLSEYMHLNTDERNYLLLLIQKDRAGSVSLRRHYEEQIKAIQKEKKEIRSRITTTHSLTDEEQLQYYENWLQTAIHMCTLVPTLRTTAEIKNYLNISIEQTKGILDTLIKIGVIQRQGTNFVSTQKRIHLGANGMALKKHHTNWRLQAINSLDRHSEQALHYTSVMSISESAAEEIKQILLKSIESYEPIIQKAKDERVYAIAMDFFEVGRQ